MAAKTLLTFYVGIQSEWEMGRGVFVRESIYTGRRLYYACISIIVVYSLAENFTSLKTVKDWYIRSVKVHHILFYFIFLNCHCEENNVAELTLM